LRPASAISFHSSFGFRLSFVIHHSDFVIPRQRLLGITLCVIAVAAGCRGTYIDVAKGKPTENENNFIANDYTEKEPSAWEKYARKTGGRTRRTLSALSNEPIARQHYDAGQKLFGDKKYDAAAKEFAAAADRWPDSSLEEDAMFMRAESYFFADSYSKANDWYGELMKKYTNSRHLNTTVARQYDIARYWQQLDEKYHRWH